ncbi:MAG TPA: hypothetical protein V6D05_10100 [Stenomitos sp.]
MSNALQRLSQAASTLTSWRPFGTAGKPPVQAGGGSLGQDTFERSRPYEPTSRMTTSQAAAYGKLTAKQREAFDRVFFGANRTGQVALSNLMEDGRLMSSKDLRKGDTLLSHLDRLATQPMASGLNRTNVLSGLVEQAENPGDISQGARGTCTVTTIEYMLAKRSPAEYVRLVTDLASSGGQAVLANGKTVGRETGTAAADDSGRSDASRLFEAAMMEYGNGLLDYSNETDKHGVGGVSFISGGLSNGDTAKVLSGVFNEDWKAIGDVPVIGSVPFTSVGSGRLFNQLESYVKKGQQVPIAMDWKSEGEWKPAGHEVLVTKIEDGRVYFRNPWGNYADPGTETDGKDGPVRRIEDSNGIESMPIDDFRKRLKGIAVK